jgi:site-specific recombinase XerC
MPSNKGRTFPPEPLTADEVKSLIMACSNRAPTGIRNRALIVMLYRGGLRISEALALRPKDLNCIAGSVRILHGKGDIRRFVRPLAGASGADMVRRSFSIGLNVRGEHDGHAQDSDRKVASGCSCCRGIRGVPTVCQFPLWAFSGMAG